MTTPYEERQIEILEAQWRAALDAEPLQGRRHALGEETLGILLGLPHIETVHTPRTLGPPACRIRPWTGASPTASPILMWVSRSTSYSVSVA